jgi:hypothetical protein
MATIRPAPAPSPEESYHSQHAPFGAFASFTIGLVGGTGGFGQSLKGPARQNVYVGFRSSAGASWQMLPFLEAPESNEVAFTGEEAVRRTPAGVVTLQPADYVRTLGWASDTWQADSGRFSFSLLTPFGAVPDIRRMTRDEARHHLAPVVCGWIEFDNRAGKEPVELMFGVGEKEAPLRPMDETQPALTGFARGTGFGYATKPAPGIEMRQGFDVFDPKYRDYRGLLVIGGETALVFAVPAGKKRRFPLVLGFFQGGVATTGLGARFAYTRYFNDLEDVLTHGLADYRQYVQMAATRDRELNRGRLNADQRFLLAQATHSYYASTQLLWHAGRPLWVVNEGEYRMINTFDLTVDHLFFELEWHPWAVRNALDLFARRYSYRDKVRGNDGRTVPGGLSFTHDMGVMNHFTAPGRSSYECDNLTGCFSHMTMEQLLNWVICAVTYAQRTGDHAWLRRQRSLLLACAASLRLRDAPRQEQRDGILKCDSDRCGPQGSEITTYDSLDVSLGQARNNLYLAVKTLGAWVLLESAFARFSLKMESAAARDTADLLARTIATKFEADTQSFPAVFEHDNRSRIIPAIEGFVYPLYLGLTDVCDRKGRFAVLLDLLSKHLLGVLQPGVCLDAKSGGWKMSSTSTNTWFSKIAIAQHVVRELFPEAMTAAALVADRVHANWQRRPGCGKDAMCDQIRSDTGVSCGSRYYPRGVTTILWMSE